MDYLVPDFVIQSPTTPKIMEQTLYLAIYKLDSNASLIQNILYYFLSQKSTVLHVRL